MAMRRLSASTENSSSAMCSSMVLASRAMNCSSAVGPSSAACAPAMPSAICLHISVPPPGLPVGHAATASGVSPLSAISPATSATALPCQVSMTYSVRSLRSHT